MFYRRLKKAAIVKPFTDRCHINLVIVLNFQRYFSLGMDQGYSQVGHDGF